MEESPRIAWAREALEISRAADETTVRARLFDRVRESEFEPPADWREAIDTLMRHSSDERRPSQELPPSDGGEGSFAPASRERLVVEHEDPTSPSFSIWKQRKALVEVETFARKLFALPPCEHRARWEALEREVRDFPVASGRLALLKPALGIPDVDCARLAPGAVRLLQQLQAALVARPSERRSLVALLVREAEGRSLGGAAGEAFDFAPEWMRIYPELMKELCEIDLQQQVVETRTVEQPRVTSAPPDIWRARIDYLSKILFFCMLGFYAFMATGFYFDLRHDVVLLVPFAVVIIFLHNVAHPMPPPET